MTDNEFGDQGPDSMYDHCDVMYPPSAEDVVCQDTMYPMWSMQSSAPAMYCDTDTMYPLHQNYAKISLAHSIGTRYPNTAGASLSRPLRVAHINAALIPAGIEYWLSALAQYSDPRVLEFVRTVVLTDWVDSRQVGRMGMPIEVGGKQSVVAAASECDVMLISDPGRHASEVADWINEARPALTVFVAHGDGDYTRDRMRGIGSAVDHIIAVTQHVQDTLRIECPSTVILNGVDPRRLVRTQPPQLSRNRYGFKEDDFVLGFVGRFSEEKNPNLVIEAIAKLPPRYKGMLVGHGYLRNELIDLAMEKIPGRFVIVEGDGDLGDLYATMDAFTVPSRLEGYGMVGMEAMMCGLPVIGTPVGMLADLATDNVDAMLVDTSGDAIAAAALKLGENEFFRKAMIESSQLLVKESGYASQMAREYETVLTDLWMQSVNRSGGGHAHW